MLISRYSFLLFLAVFTVQWCGAETIYNAIKPSILLAVSTSENGTGAKGTAFLYDNDSKDSLVYLVTCKHLVDNCSSVFFYRTINEEGVLWQWIKDKHNNNTCGPAYGDDNDIAVYPVSRAVVAEWGLVPFKNAKLRDELEVGAPIHWVGGFFKNQADSGRITLRYGMLSLIDEDDRRIGEVLMDGISTPGFSGSPIVYFDKQEDKIYVIGMMCGEYVEPATPVYAPMSGEDSTMVRRALPLPTGMSYGIDFDSIEQVINRAKRH